MSRSIPLENKYYFSEYETQKRNISNTEYSIPIDNITVDKDSTSNISGVLPYELDIFSELPDFVYDNYHAKKFIMALKNNILIFGHSILSEISLSKLRVSEHDEDYLLLEWIFNYFRLYFGFDKNDGDFFGEVMNNPENGEFHNDIKKMKIDEYDAVTKANLLYVAALVQGRNIK